VESSRPFHLNSSVNEIAVTWLGRRVKEQLLAGFRKNMGLAGNDEGLERMFGAMAGEMPLRGLEMFSGGALSRRQLEILVALLNWRLLRAAKLYLNR
jgi:hypothetical protein